MKDKTRGSMSENLSDAQIIESIQSSAEEAEAFCAPSQWGYEKLKVSIASRGDSFDRCGEIIFEEDGKEILRIPVACMPVTIGSGEKVDYALDFPGLSRMHCHLEYIGSLVRIHDDASTNGVVLNGKKIASEDLCDGDEVKLGMVSLRIRKV
jgi:hypothetical protein